jgi:hypothetical protein
MRPVGVDGSFCLRASLTRPNRRLRPVDVEHAMCLEDVQQATGEFRPAVQMVDLEEAHYFEPVSALAP